MRSLGRGGGGVIFAGLLAWFAAGCGISDRYTFYPANDSKDAYYRLDKMTGDVQLVQGTSMAQVRDKAAASRGLGDLKDWGERAIPGRGIKVHLKTKWRAKELLYVVQVAPYDSVEQYRYSGSVTVVAADKDGFTLADVPVQLSGMTRIIDEKGVPVELSSNGSWAMDAEKYRAMSSWLVGWSLP